MIGPLEVERGAIASEVNPWGGRALIGSRGCGKEGLVKPCNCGKLESSVFFVVA